MPLKIESLSDAINQNNVNNVEYLAHSIKGVALNMRCDILSALCHKLELLAAGKNYDKEIANKLLIDIKDEFPKIKFD